MIILNAILILIGFSSMLATFWIANFRVFPSRTGKFYDTVKQIKTIMTIFLCIYLFSGALSLQDGLQEYQTYMYHTDGFVTVNATIVDIVEDTDSDGDTNYEVYVTYEHNGQTVSANFWKSTSKRQYQIGEQIPLEISSKDVTYINKNAGGQFDLVLTLAFYACSAYIVSEFIIKSCKKENDEQYLLSRHMIIHDVRPKNMNLLYKIFLAFGSAFIYLSLLETNIFTSPSSLVGLLLLILSVVLGYLVIKKTAKTYCNGVPVYRRKCLKRSVEKRPDDDIIFTHFEGRKVTQGTVGTVGRTYYIVGDFDNLYDEEFFVLDSNESEVKETVRKFIQRFIIDGILICAASCVFAYLVYYVMQQKIVLL